MMTKTKLRYTNFPERLKMHPDDPCILVTNGVMKQVTIALKKNGGWHYIPESPLKNDLSIKAVENAST